MSKRDIRPPDGPGANGLRGGRGAYPSGKTAIGVWLDSKGGPSGYKRGFHSGDYETECQHQQKGAQFGSSEFFGAELPPKEHLHRKPPCSADLFDSNYSKEPPLDYMTNTRLQYQDSTILIKESHLPLSNMPREQLVEYQKTWSSDTPAARVIRFQTEARRASNAANKNFQTPSLRLLPGTPTTLEQYRSKLLEKFGVLALAVFRYFIGEGEMTCQEWRQRLVLTQIKLFPHEVNQILAFFTATDTINVDQFVRMVTARNDGFDKAYFEELFKSTYGASDARVSHEDMIASMDAANTSYAEIIEGLKEFGGCYIGQDDGLYGMKEFIAIMTDLHSCTNAIDFKKMVNGLFGIEEY
jgi:hypothetical protein